MNEDNQKSGIPILNKMLSKKKSSKVKKKLIQSLHRIT